MKSRIIILAGGRGKRMQSETAKVLTPLNGRPLISHLLESIESSGIDPRPVIVVGYAAEEVKKTLGSRYDYVLQEAQLGTGHAVGCAEALLRGNADSVVVINGDQPFIQPSTFSRLQDLHEREGRVLTIMTTRVSDFDDWRAPFFDFGRIVRDAQGNIMRIVEKKDATDLELGLAELNSSVFCFNAEWLWSHLGRLINDNAQGEYYITDLVRMAIDEGEQIASAEVSPLEAIGVNTKEHLNLLSTTVTNHDFSLSAGPDKDTQVYT